MTAETVVAETLMHSNVPEWLPEKFNDPADLGKAYKALESKLGEKEEDIRTSPNGGASMSKHLKVYLNHAGDYELA